LSDKARIGLSSAFRRLQTKAQVFSLERNAAVRTRLTHTIEVSIYGALIAEAAFERLRSEDRIEADLRFPFVQTVENACFIHDIGNPPFGHLGEFAIREWFRTNRDSVLGYWKSGGMRLTQMDRHFPAFEHFDGNPQGLRIVTHLQWLHDENGLNLTCSLLASSLKYLAPSPEDHPFANKIGFYEPERALVTKVWNSLGLPLMDGRPAQRHPLVFLMEAADDIAYCLSDIEDAIEKHVVTENEFFAAMRRFAEFIPDKDRNVHRAANNTRFIEFRTKLTSYLVQKAVDAYCDNEAAILDGTLIDSLLAQDPKAKTALKFLKNFARQRIFLSREAVEIELGGFDVVHGILDKYTTLLKLSRKAFGQLLASSEKPMKYGELPLESRLFSLLPNKYLLAYRHSVLLDPTVEAALRTHLIVDYLASMTDTHAFKIYNMLNGTSHFGIE
jgi:dGTPase